MTKTVRCIDYKGNLHDIPVEEMSFRPSVYGILIDDGKILMVKDAWGGNWELPGGGAHVEEQLTDVLKREFAEETGIEIEPDEFLTFQEDFFCPIHRYSGGWHSLRFYYRVKRIGGAIRTTGNGNDVSEVRWLSQTDLSERDVSKPAIVPIMEKLGFV